MTFLNWITDIRISVFLDIAFIAILIYAFLIWFKKTRAASVLTGIFIMAFIYLLARQFNMVITATVFEKFFAVIFLALIIIFQEELRHVFEKIASWSVNQKLLTRHMSESVLPEVEILVLSLADLANEKIGALIVLKGNDLLARHLDGGVALNADLSEPILKSIFDPHSVGHDGAVIIEGNRITQFMSHLPLSKNVAKLGHTGTRHAAALGLSELSDALCLVVSEEQGTISIAKHGALDLISEPAKLTKIIDKFYRDTHPKQNLSIWRDFFKINIREKSIALFVSLAVWFILVHGSTNIYYTLPVKVKHAKLPVSWAITKIEPDKVDITFKGPRRTFYFFSQNKVSLVLEPKLEFGTQTINLGPPNLTFPNELTLEDIEPSQITLHMQKQVQGGK